MTFGSLFAGIGGFDLGFERAGLTCAWQVENNRWKTALLRDKWPTVRRIADARQAVESDLLAPVDVICGGDPCPKHSGARGNKRSLYPDLAGYFLALAGRLRPRWLVRENVPAPTVDHFAAALEALGYGCVVIQFDGAEITGQSRTREFVVAKHQASRESVRQLFSAAGDCSYSRPANLGVREVIPALTKRRFRASPRDCYILESGRIRTLDGEEREAFAGFPRGWTSGFDEETRAAMLGDAVIPAKAEWIGRRIIQDPA